MKTFWEYLNNEEVSDPYMNDRPTSEGEYTSIDQSVDRSPAPPASVPAPASAPAPASGSMPAPTSRPATTSYRARAKVWKAKKAEILTFWKNLSPSIPLQLEPIENLHKGSTLQQDTIRITGSKEFITTVLSRLKDFVIYESPETKLVLDYRQNAKSLKPGEKNSYLFYVNVRKRK
jgi:hypothetical protein